MKVVRTRATASAPCRSFAAAAASEAAAARKRHARLPPLPLLKERWCSHSSARRPRPPPPRPQLPAVPVPASTVLDSEGEEFVAPQTPEISGRDGVVDAPPSAHAHDAALTSVGAAIGHVAHHHQRHKILRPPPLSASMMLKLREDLLAGRDASPTSVVETGEVTAGPAPPPPQLRARVENLQVASAVKKPAGAAALAKSQRTEDEDEDVDEASAPATRPAVATAPTSVPERGGRLGGVLSLASHGFSWVRSRLVGALDFVCDGRCGVQPRTAPSLIIN